jgi:hypothetical protein
MHEGAPALSPHSLYLVTRAGEINVACCSKDCRLCGAGNIPSDYKRNHCPSRTVMGIVGNRCVNGELERCLLHLFTAAPSRWCINHNDKVLCLADRGRIANT